MQHSKLRIALHHSNSDVFDMSPYTRMGEPVGDPNGGPAFGEKNSKKFFKKIVAVAGIVATVMTAGAAAPLMAGIMYAGAALSTVGLITGNSQLAMIGGLASMGAGLAQSYQAGTGIFSGLEKTASGLTNAGEVASTATSQAQGLLGGSSSVTPTAGSISSTLSSAANDVGSAVNSANTSSAGLSNIEGMGMRDLANSSSQVADTAAVAGGSINAPSLDIAGSASVGDPLTKGFLPEAAAVASDPSLLDMGMDKIKGLQKSIEDNPTSSKLVADFIKGAYQSPEDKAKAKAMIDYYKAGTANANANAAVTNAGMINAQAVPTMNMNINPNAPVKFNTAIRGGQGIGLLNRSTQLA